MSAPTLNLDDFVYVDVAFGGVNRRNNVKRVDEVHLNGVADCYVSHNRATAALLKWRNEHKNENGNPTVAGFDGETWADNLHLDYDNEADPGQALVWLRQGLDWFEAHDVDLRALRIYFSGCKGFGVEAPHTLFGGFEPAADFHTRLWRAAKRILGDTPYDSSVYDKIRLWRLPNSRHSKSGLYKIRLTVAEARTLTIDEIRALAASPRDESAVAELAPIADDEWLPAPELVAIWEATVSPNEDESGEPSERRPPTNEARARLTVAAIAASWPHGGRNAVEGESENATVSRHAEYLMPIIGFLAGRISAARAGEIVAEAAQEAGDQTFLNGRDWRSEIKRIVDSTAVRMKPGQTEARVKGLLSLRKEFPGLADVLEALWPAMRINFGDEDEGTDDQSAPVGDAVLSDVHGFLGRFVAYPKPEAHVAHTLWVGHAHLMKAWESTPRIAFLSPEPGSGKTRALEATELLVPRPVEAVNVTPAYLFRKVGDAAGLPTILYDEIDTVFGPKAKDNEEIRGLLNAGHRRGAVAGRCVVKGKTVETEEIPAYCAVALAGLGGLPDTILSRSVILRMRRRAPGEHVEPFRRRVHEAEGHAVRDRLKLWAASVEDAATDYWPEMPPGIVDRDSDVWEPLLTVADLAGGEWPARARCAAVTLVTDSKESTPSLGVRLLVDLRAIFGVRDVMSTESILSALNSLEEAPWGEISKGKPLNARGVSRRLSQYGVASKTVRIGAVTAKGYAAADLADAWARYAPLSHPESVTSVTDDPGPPGQDVTDRVTDEPSLSVTDSDVDLCATCGVNPVEMVGLDCDECMGLAS